MSEAKDINLLERFLAGNIAAEEEARLRDWAETNLAAPASVDLLRSKWQQPVDVTELDSDRMWAAIRDGRSLEHSDSTLHKSVDKPLSSLMTDRNVNGRFLWPKRWSHAASAGVSIAALCVMIFVGTLVSDRPSSDGQNYREYVTERGQRAIVYLPDGTKVTLGPESSLRLTMDSGALKSRFVDLSGQAFFSVESNSSVPFIVRAGSSITQVLGTSFNIRSYSDDEEARVAVASGRVSIRSLLNKTEPALILSANEGASVDKLKGNIAQINESLLSVETGWTNGQYVFNSTPAHVVTEELGRAFNLDFEFQDNRIRSQLLTMSFASESISTVLEILSATLPDVKVERNGKRVILSRHLNSR